jgi:hypothetical protein
LGRETTKVFGMKVIKVLLFLLYNSYLVYGYRKYGNKYNKKNSIDNIKVNNIHSPYIFIQSLFEILIFELNQNNL